MIFIYHQALVPAARNGRMACTSYLIVPFSTCWVLGPCFPRPLSLEYSGIDVCHLVKARSHGLDQRDLRFDSVVIDGLPFLERGERGPQRGSMRRPSIWHQKQFLSTDVTPRSQLTVPDLGDHRTGDRSNIKNSQIHGTRDPHVLHNVLRRQGWNCYLV